MAFTEFETDTQKFLIHAVNVLLQTIGEAPIETLEDLEEVYEAQIATDVIVETKKEILGDTWDFNQDNGMLLPVDINGYITVPFNVLDISSADGDLIMRDWRLYSKSDYSPIFTEAKEVDIVWDMAFNTLSHPLRNYITIRASRKFQARQIMDSKVYAYTQDDEDTARIIARRSDARTSKSNMYSSEYGSNYLIDGTL